MYHVVLMSKLLKGLVVEAEGAGSWKHQLNRTWSALDR